MISFFWIVTILFIILLIAQWTVFLSVRKYILGRQRVKIGLRSLPIIALSVIINLIVAYLSIMPNWGGQESILKQSLTVSYFFYLGISLALFIFFLALGGADVILRAISAAVGRFTIPKDSSVRKVSEKDTFRPEVVQENLPTGQTVEYPNSRISRRTFMRYAATTGTAAIATLGSYGLVEAYDEPRTELIDITDPCLAGLSRPIRIAHVTDIHYGMFFGSFSLTALVASLNSIEADAVVLTGDLFHSPNTPVESAAPILGKLRNRRWGNFAVLGNHDFYAGVDRSVKAIKDGGMRLLRNEWLEFHEYGVDIAVGGIDDPLANWLTGNHFPAFGKFMSQAPRSPGFRILLSHRPVVFPLAVRENIHLTLSGHTHGGQITFPAPGENRPWSLAALVSPYTLGMYESGNSRMYVNRGVGLTFVPARINCPPEIAVMNLVPPGFDLRGKKLLQGGA